MISAFTQHRQDLERHTKQEGVASPDGRPSAVLALHTDATTSIESGVRLWNDRSRVTLPSILVGNTILEGKDIDLPFGDAVGQHLAVWLDVTLASASNEFGSYLMGAFEMTAQWGVFSADQYEILSGPLLVPKGGTGYEPSDGVVTRWSFGVPIAFAEPISGQNRYLFGGVSSFQPLFYQAIMPAPFSIPPYTLI